MSAEASVATLRNTMEEFQADITRVRARSFEAVARLALLGEADHISKEVDVLRQILAEMEQAKHVLGKGLDDGFSRLNQEMPSGLRDSSSKCLRILTGFVTDLSSAVSQAERDSVTSATCRNLLVQLVESLFPAVTQVMQDIPSVIAQFEDEAGKNNHTLITSAVSEIDDINSVINLISVNASVEAARAGPAGRGFAVIASEIQSLSHRSQQAVSNIRSQLR
ncbi:MAG: methyl-accepting chemotaxis protein [Pseudomonadota bacterium]